jgi:hypothetical protein
MRQDTALHIVIEFPFDVGGEASGVRIGVEGGEKRLQMSGHNLVEQCLARIMGGIRGWFSFQRRWHGDLGVCSKGSIVLIVVYNCPYVHYMKDYTKLS